VKVIYGRGLDFLASSQQEDGSWPSGQSGGGITGLCLMAFLAHGEDPNYGPYQAVIRRAVLSILQGQEPSSGYIPNSMYHHGFAMLALAEAYGAVDESRLGPGTRGPAERPTIGQALRRAVRCAVAAQQRNNFGGWRYSPTSPDADTSVTGAVMMGLLAARNAGLDVPDESVDKGLAYLRTSTDESGVVAYSGGVGGFGESMNRSAITTLVLAVARRQEWPQFQATRRYITDRLEHEAAAHPFYFRYYMAQALFQTDYDAWIGWSRDNTRILRQLQRDGGGFPSNHGPAYGTAMSLLSLALEFRFLPIYER
jgi:hypothetical protein